MKLCWAHPKFGSVLASCGYDRKVIVWREVAASSWVTVHECIGHEASVNTVDWAPWEHGLLLAAGSSDGCVTVITRVSEDRWESQKFLAHESGVTSLSWASVGPSSALTDVQRPVLKQFLTGGGDQWVKMWTYADGSYKPENFYHHTQWVRDVAWAPCLGFTRQVAASCSESGAVVVHTRESDREQWRHKEIVKLPGPVWRVSWSVAGSLLAVSASDAVARLYKENLEGTWELTSQVNEKGALVGPEERSSP